MADCDRKPISDLTPDDLARWPVWQYVLDDEEEDETWVQPVTDLPVTDLANRVVGAQARLASGEAVWCLLGNVELQSLRTTQQFLTLTVFRPDGAGFDLARYFDVDYLRRGPDALAAFIGLQADAVFPIAYDISQWAEGLPAVTRGTITLEPAERLSDVERMSLLID